MASSSGINGLRIKDLVQTCTACPSQWEAVTEDGRPVYVRYRCGTGRVGVGAPGDDIMAAVGAYPSFTWDGDDPYDGFITEDEMLRITGLVVADG